MSRPPTKLLHVPVEFSRYETIEDQEIITKLLDWKQKSTNILNELRDFLVKEQEIPLDEQADIIAAVAPFDGHGLWVTSESHKTACDILEHWAEPDVPLLSELLLKKLKPLFQANPHPSLNLSTGRKLARQAGGPMASQDYYDTQIWKEHPGTANLVSWCIRHIKSHDYERLWHLIIPPVMTLIDDYQVPYKIHGVEIVQEMLQHVPVELLRRTGIDGLLRTSLNTCLGQLQDEGTPRLLRAVIPTTVHLVQLTTARGSNQSFDQLCALLGDGIIGTIWLYASDSQETIIASVECLAVVIQALGIGTLRYLKALVPQLTHPLNPNEFQKASQELQIASLRALRIVLEECAPRIEMWKGTILDAIVRCWVHSSDQLELKIELQTTCLTLIKVCPSVQSKELSRLLALDADTFGSLVTSSDQTKEATTP
ncbi:hypothetical protein C8J56DRAFT_351967 [Mycena floridula]|nr:hypothetical protein C8J56DRAFT_351967 [Mycena floridula]